jgi:HEAT repeat protein
MAVAEARAAGLLHNRAQVLADCRAALVTIKQPMRRSRLLRLITDLSLTQMSVDILPLLQGLTSDERAASARALGRMDIRAAIEPISLLLHDPVQDVRKAALTALRHMLTKDARNSRPVASRGADGTRSWVIENTTQPPSKDDDDGWKSRLRSIIDA